MSGPSQTSSELTANIVRVGAVLSLVIGGGTGFVLGIHYPPTVAFAVVEGVILVGVPIFFVTILVALAAAGVQGLGARRARR
jgi:hypothetical protein